MKATALISLSLLAILFSGCTTPVAIDPLTGQEQKAEYRAGYFYAPLAAPMGEVFRTAIREIDAMGYFRTGELHRETSITIYGRQVGDDAFTVRIKQLEDGQSEIRIRMGRLGNLATSQGLYSRIREAL